jgi:exodeoxyribonuclease VII large subunit
MVISARQQLEQQMQSLSRRLEHGIRYRLMLNRQRFQDLSEHRAVLRITDAIRRRQQRLDDLSSRLLIVQRDRLQILRRRLELAAIRVRHHDLRRRLEHMRKDLQTVSSQLPRAIRAVLLNRRAFWEQLNAKLNTLSPLKILERGYAVVFDPAGMPLTDSAQVSAGDEVNIRLARGRVEASVLKTRR